MSNTDLKHTAILAKILSDQVHQLLPQFRGTEVWDAQTLLNRIQDYIQMIERKTEVKHEHVTPTETDPGTEGADGEDIRPDRGGPPGSNQGQTPG